jgi:NAD(P)-dependent dehydrogenase (short-subunit alcohol dehydrogenase family)
MADRTGIRLDGSVALITGSTGALGGVTARRFRAAGARLALPARDPAKLAEALPELAADPDGVLALAGDLDDPAAVDALVAATVERFGRLDLVVHVAGGFAGGRPVADTPVEVWDRQWHTNARPAFLLSRAAARVMRERRSGAIVHVASTAALAGGAGVAAYSASKAAVVRLTESLAAELAGSGVRVNCVLPGTIDTAANRAAMPDADRSKWVDPEAIAEVLLFLVSPAAAAVHGAALPVTGAG